MKQVIRKGLKDIIVDEVPDPGLLPHHVLVRPLYSLISSGTETASIHRDSLLSRGGRQSVAPAQDLGRRDEDRPGGDPRRSARQVQRVRGAGIFRRRRGGGAARHRDRSRDRRAGGLRRRRHGARRDHPGGPESGGAHARRGGVRARLFRHAGQHRDERGAHGADRTRRRGGGDRARAGRPTGGATGAAAGRRRGRASI